MLQYWGGVLKKKFVKFVVQDLTSGGHEWMRAKWSAPIRRYWKTSEQMIGYLGADTYPYIQNTYMDVLRAIDWTRGKPYVWKKGDYGILIDSNCLFARKFDFTNSPEIVEMLYEKIKE